ncbi:MAG: hypothetical protein ACLQIJ_05720, partial [Polyangia bacterium]
VRGPPVLSVVEQPREWRGPWPRRWIPIGARSVVHAPQFIEKSHIAADLDVVFGELASIFVGPTSQNEF